MAKKKQTSEDNFAVTQNDLRELKSQLMSNLANKLELTTEVKAAKLDLKADLMASERRIETSLENKIEVNSRILKDEIQNGFDKVFKELEKMREDRIFALAKDRGQDKRLDALEASRV